MPVVQLAPPIAVPFDVMYCTVDVWFRFPVLVTVIVAVCDSSSMYVADENCTDAVTGVPVGVGLGLTLGVGFTVGEGVGVAHTPPASSETLSTLKFATPAVGP